MNASSKKKVVKTANALVAAFPQAIVRDGATGYALRVCPVGAGQSELHLEAGQDKSIFQIRPLLHPSRKLIKDRREDELLLFAHLPEPLATEFRAAGICHADLNGRVFIAIPGFILDRDPKENIFRNPGSDTALFAPKASRIIRAVLSQRDREWTQEELTERTGISRGLVSRLLTALVADEYLTKERSSPRGSATQYRVRDFNRLLDAWKVEDDWSERVTVRQYSLLSNDASEIAKNIRDALDSTNVVFTQWFAAHIRHPYTTPPVVSAYIKSPRVPELQFARAVPSGGNLWLIVPADEGVFFETQEQEGFRLVSDVQIYLDLVEMGQRGPDAAKALREWNGFAR